MKLLKLICFFFIIHFIRKFYRAYKALKAMQEAQVAANQEQARPEANVINADFKVID